MSGLFLLLVAGIWIFIAVKLSFYIDRKFPENIRGIPFILLLAAFIPLPIMDEIIYGPQFENLCEKYSGFTLDTQNIKGRTVWFSGVEDNSIKLGTIKVSIQKLKLVDAETQEPVYHFYRLQASSGILARLLGIFNGGSFLFKTTCQSHGAEDINRQLNIKYVERKNLN